MLSQLEKLNLRGNDLRTIDHRLYGDRSTKLELSLNNISEMTNLESVINLMRFWAFHLTNKLASIYMMAVLCIPSSNDDHIPNIGGLDKRYSI
ncbi:hypothetical protein DASC09_043070 [Saccharomycopsis crataegensis]|uniref:Uncharacterized protein n=1 Tax=Saccharomycopsis crataegensis TaxID=43959 RepID=A0AAV5QR93_9ASCO|nr:hypothetical protein DASC09_043070 [Saccharomycopsis crataegensis]